MNTWILIIFLANDPGFHSEASGIVQEFSENTRCISAGKAIAADAEKRGNYVLTWGCFQK